MPRNSDPRFERYFMEVNNKVIHGDALDVLSQMPDSCVDACVTDPPFGIGFKYEKQEDFSDPDAYWEWLKPIHDQIVRILKPGGFLAIWQAQKNFRHFWDWFGDDIHIYDSRTIIVVKP